MTDDVVDMAEPTQKWRREKFGDLKIDERPLFFPVIRLAAHRTSASFCAETTLHRSLSTSASLPCPTTDFENRKKSKPRKEQSNSLNFYFTSSELSCSTVLSIIRSSTLRFGRFVENLLTRGILTTSSSGVSVFRGCKDSAYASSESQKMLQRNFESTNAAEDERIHFSRSKIGCINYHRRFFSRLKQPQRDLVRSCYDCWSNLSKIRLISKMMSFVSADRSTDLLCARKVGCAESKSNIGRCKRKIHFTLFISDELVPMAILGTAYATGELLCAAPRRLGR